MLISTYDTPSGVPFRPVPKTGSTSLRHALYQAMFVSRARDGTHHRRHVTALESSRRLRSSTTVHMLVREPMTRFLSSLAHLSIQNVDDVLTDLEDYAGGAAREDLRVLNTRDTLWHIIPVQHWLPEVGALYRFPQHVPELCVALGLKNGLRKVNEATNDKPVLTGAQLARARKVFAADIDLYESIKVPGQTFNKHA